MASIPHARSGPSHVWARARVKASWGSRGVQTHASRSIGSRGHDADKDIVVVSPSEPASPLLCTGPPPRGTRSIQGSYLVAPHPPTHHDRPRPRGFPTFVQGASAAAAAARRCRLTPPSHLGLARQPLPDGPLPSYARQSTWRLLAQEKPGASTCSIGSCTQARSRVARWPQSQTQTRAP